MMPMELTPPQLTPPQLTQTGADLDHNAVADVSALPRVLRSLARRRHLSSAAAGQPFGITSTAVRVATNRVIAADLAESGEPVQNVSAHYQFYDGRSP